LIGALPWLHALLGIELILSRGDAIKSAASTPAYLTAWKAVLPAYCVAPDGECTQGAFTTRGYRIACFLLIAEHAIAACVLCLTIIGLPVGFWTSDAAPAIVSLKRT
jgi:hypothetical protein